MPLHLTLQETEDLLAFLDSLNAGNEGHDDRRSTPSPSAAHPSRPARLRALQAGADGSRVHVLLSLAGGSMATFTLQPGQVSAAVRHRTVEELWYLLAGAGQMWRRDASSESIAELSPGLRLSVPLGTAFQFRCSGGTPLVAVAVTLPPWPGEDEAQPATGLLANPD